MSIRELKILAWDHERSFQPLRAAAAKYQSEERVSIKINQRPLSAFEEQPLEEVIREYDLVSIDHPFLGEAAGSGMFKPLNDFLNQSDLSAIHNQYIGPSLESYSWQDKIWAFPIDAACQVSAYRTDLFDDIKQDVPEDRNSVDAFINEHPGQTAISLNPIHTFCTLLTLCAGEKGKDKDGPLLLNDLFIQLEWLKSIKHLLHPDSSQLDPIGIYEKMTSTDDIFYVPFIFGYINYARKTFRKKRVAFANVPNKSNTGAVLGGVGLAVSSYSSNAEQAIQFARFLSGSDFQAGEYTEVGGQPAARDAWYSEKLDRLCGGFFSNTIQSIQQSYLRPRHSGYHLQQSRMAVECHRHLWEDTPLNQEIFKKSGIFV